MTCPFYAFSSALEKYYPDPAGFIGESRSYYLIGPHVAINPIMNDFSGETDKYMSQASSATVYHSLDEDRGFTLRAGWYIITKALKSFQGGRPFEPSKGKNADVISASASYGFKPTYWLAFDAAVGFSHAGNKGGLETQRDFHESIGVGNEFEPKDQKTGGFLLAQTSAKVLLPIGDPHHLAILELGHESNLMARSNYSEITYLHKESAFSVALSFKTAFSFASALYGDELRKIRTETGIYAVIGNYQPGIKFVSPLLKGDGKGQIYLDIAKFTIE